MNCRKPKQTHTFKLTYFNIPGRSLLMRLMFAEAGVNYEYETVEFVDWPKVKPTTPTGFLPMLTIDGNVKMGQTGSITRYLAQELKLEPTTSISKAKADMTFHSLEDVFSKIPFKEQDEEKKKELMAECFNDHIIPFFEKVEKYLDTRPKNEFLTGKNITYIDLAMLSYTTLMKSMEPDLLKTCSRVKALVDKVGERPRIKAFLQKQFS